MSYFITINEGWKNYAHSAVKGILMGGMESQPEMANSKLFRPIHKFADNKFFNHLFTLNKINNKIYSLCSKLANPINNNKEQIIDKKKITSYFNYKSNKHLDGKVKFSVTKKIFDTNHENFYLVRFTFDDQKIYAADIIIPANTENTKASKIINIRNWNNIKPEEYLN